MPTVVKVSTVETIEKLMSAIEGYFRNGQYAEIQQAIGMHSILMKPENMREDQKKLYGFVLEMIKGRIAGRLGKQYAVWYSTFAGRMDAVATGGQLVTDQTIAGMLSAYRAAYGPFKSVDAFYFWALEDRKLRLDQIIAYLEKTADIQAG